jgi:hypothetical protein
MDKGTFMWITLSGCMKLNLINSWKHFVIIIALMDNFDHGTGELVNFLTSSRQRIRVNEVECWKLNDKDQTVKEHELC